MILITGLGNPGPAYAGNRHNIGFMAVDAIAARWGFAPWRARFQGMTSEGVADGVRILLLKPGTYMNESGRAVAEAMRFYKLPLESLIVFHDELDLAPARLRIKIGGGNAGHNGLRSITAHMGNDYKRVRLGIGHPGDKRLVHPYVLSDFARSERDWVEALCTAIADNIGYLAKGDDAGFQNKVHLAMDTKGFRDVKRPGERETE